MNKKVEIRVKMLLGITDSKQIGPTVTQGRVESGVISSNNVDVGLKEAFVEEDREIKYKELVVNALSYMDDIFRMAENKDNAQFGNDVIFSLLNQKNLELNI